MWLGGRLPLLPFGLPRTLGRWMFVAVTTLLLLAVRTGAGEDGKQGDSSSDCPRPCFCNTLGNIVYCSRRGLDHIPGHLPDGTLQLNMNGNIFKNPSLQRRNFTNIAGLQHLYLSECGLENIEENTFSDMKDLLWLDLSNNRIKLVPDFTFRGLTLQHLFLNGNRNVQLRALSFEGLVTTGLYLHDCGLEQLRSNVLSPLNSTLRYLWLNGNELERVSKKLASLFGTLSHVRLGNNPLHCNCEFKWLKQLYDKNEEIFKGAVAPSCFTPPSLKGKVFNEMTLADFRCQPPNFNNIDVNLHDQIGKLKCSASGDPAPSLYWIQPTGKATRYNPPASEDAKKTEGTLTLAPEGAPDKHNLRGMYICVANNEAGNVTMTINVTWPANAVTYRTVTYKTVVGDVSTTTTTVLPPANDAPRPAETVAPALEHPSHVPEDKAKPAGLSPAGAENPNPSTSREGRTKNNPNDVNTNYTALNMLDLNLNKNGHRLFNLTELIGAVIGTFVCTLLLCLIFMPIYYKRRWKSRRHLNHLGSNGLEKPPPCPETMYLNGSHNVPDYMDIPTPTKR